MKQQQQQQQQQQQFVDWNINRITFKTTIVYICETKPSKKRKRSNMIFP